MRAFGRHFPSPAWLVPSSFSSASMSSSCTKRAKRNHQWFSHLNHYFQLIKNNVFFKFYIILEWIEISFQLILIPFDQYKSLHKVWNQFHLPLLFDQNEKRGTQTRNDNNQHTQEEKSQTLKPFNEFNLMKIAISFNNNSY